MTVGFEARNDSNNLLIDGNFQNLVYVASGTATTDTVHDQFSVKTINLNGLTGYPVVAVQAASGGYAVVRSYSNGAAVVDIVLLGGVGTSCRYFVYALPTAVPSNFAGMEIYNQAGQLVFSTAYRYMRVVGTVSGRAGPGSAAASLTLPSGRSYAVIQTAPMAYARVVNQSPAPPSQDWFLYSFRGCFAVNGNVVTKVYDEFQIVHYGQTQPPGYDMPATAFVLDVTDF